MKRIVLAFALVFSPALVMASPADCLLVADGRTIIDGPCEFDLLPVGNGLMRGSFQITAGENFAVVNVYQKDAALGYRNEFPNSRQPSGRLGVLSPSGACWLNENSKVCAWKAGERSSASPSSNPSVAPQLKSFNGYTTAIGEVAPQFSVSAMQIWREFSQNEPAAIEKYTAAEFFVEGTVLSVRYGRPGLSQKEQIFVELNSSPYGDHVRAFLDDTVSSSAKYIQTNKTIRFICITAMKLPGSIDLGGCR